MAKYNLQVNRYSYHSIYYYLNNSYGIKKSLEHSETKYADVYWVIICNQIP